MICGWCNQRVVCGVDLGKFMEVSLNSCVHVFKVFMCMPFPFR